MVVKVLSQFLRIIERAQTQQEGLNPHRVGGIWSALGIVAAEELSKKIEGKKDEEVSN